MTIRRVNYAVAEVSTGTLISHKKSGDISHHYPIRWCPALDEPYRLEGVENAQWLKDLAIQFSCLSKSPSSVYTVR